MPIERVFHHLNVIVLAFVMTGLLAWSAKESVQWLFGDRFDQINAQWWQETKGLDLIAAHLIETDDDGTSQLSDAFSQATREWLNAESPGVEVIDAAMEASRNAAGDANFWRVSYRLEDDRQSVLQAMYCLDNDGERVQCP